MPHQKMYGFTFQKFYWSNTLRYLLTPIAFIFTQLGAIELFFLDFEEEHFAFSNKWGTTVSAGKGTAHSQQTYRALDYKR